MCPKNYKLQKDSNPLDYIIVVYDICNSVMYKISVSQIDHHLRYFVLDIFLKIDNKLNTFDVTNKNYILNLKKNKDV